MTFVCLKACNNKKGLGGKATLEERPDVSRKVPPREEVTEAKKMESRWTRRKRSIADETIEPCNENWKISDIRWKQRANLMPQRRETAIDEHKRDEQMEEELALM